ncbi:MAG: hypothetical protein HeimC3_34930 [Candidatus Heimdallarchaeota archaeon LC_3]|nr:MAG: hypothetical protein HeimC3_34930 [Candidatus Heimdallarchaeota archaeon LC_3]
MYKHLACSEIESIPQNRKIEKQDQRSEQQINPLFEILEKFYQDVERNFDRRGPSLFSKILLGYQTQQELVDLSYSLFRREYTSLLLTYEDIKLLTKIFSDKYKISQSQLKKSYLISMGVENIT